MPSMIYSTLAAMTIGVTLPNAVHAQSLTSAEQAVARCDAAAGHPDDPDRVGAAVEKKSINLAEAIKLCAQAKAAAPGNARIRYQLGRVLFYDGQTERAMSEVKASADAGHRQAQFVYGVFVINKRDHAPKDPCIAERHWKSSAEAGRQAARMNYVRYALKGTFKQCAGKATAANMAEMLKAGKAEASEYYQRVLFDELEEHFKASVRANKAL